MRFLLVLFWISLLPGVVAAQVSGQSFEVTPEVDSATVGDTVTLRFRVRLDERDLLFDSVPQPIAALPPGLRILSVEKLTRTPDRIFHGRARLAFYRTGRRAVPVFGLPFMRAVKGLGRGTIPSDSAFVAIVALTPAGNPSLKDIREIDLAPGRSPWILVAAALAALLLIAAYVRLRSRQADVTPTLTPVTAPPTEPSFTPYALALDQLHLIERARWPEHGQVERHYEAIVDVLRQYLSSAEEIPARERTSDELLWALPPHLSEGDLRDSFRPLLDQADRVKFAQLRPHSRAAQEFLNRCRSLLDRWHQAVPTDALADAIR